MNFKRIDSDACVSELGLKIVGDAQRDEAVFADICRSRGENYADSLSDVLWDGFCPVCTLEDDVSDSPTLYTVLFDWAKDQPRAVYWAELARVEEVQP